MILDDSKLIVPYACSKEDLKYIMGERISEEDFKGFLQYVYDSCYMVDVIQDNLHDMFVNFKIEKGE